MSLTRKAITLAPSAYSLASGVPAARALNLAAKGEPAAHGHGGHGAAGPRADKPAAFAGRTTVGPFGITSQSRVNGESRGVRGGVEQWMGSDRRRESQRDAGLAGRLLGSEEAAEGWIEGMASSAGLQAVLLCRDGVVGDGVGRCGVDGRGHGLGLP